MTQNSKSPAKETVEAAEISASIVATPQTPEAKKIPAPEYGGRKGPEATRYGDWEMNGKCVDF